MKSRPVLLVAFAATVATWVLWPAVDDAGLERPGDDGRIGDASGVAVPQNRPSPHQAVSASEAGASVPAAETNLASSGHGSAVASRAGPPADAMNASPGAGGQAAAPTGTGGGVSRAANPPGSGPTAAEFEERRADARRFIASLYRDFAGTAGDEKAIALWADLIAAGTWTREQAVEHFLDAAPTLQGAAPLARLYFAFFQRVPDEAGWSHWRNVVASGQDLRSVSELFAASPEFSATYGSLSDGQFVDLVFRNTLGRAATPAELTLWEGQFTAGLATRGQMMLAFAETAAFREAVAPEVNASLLYSGLLGRTADTPGLAAWMRTVENRGITRAEMIAGFLQSAEYQARRPATP